MSWDLANLNPGVRYFFPDLEDQWVELKVASDEDNKEMFRKAGIKFAKKQIYNAKDRKMELVTDIDDDESKRQKYNQEIWDFCITDWHLVDNHNNEIPCTRENKILLMSKSPKFATFVGDKLEELRNGLSLKKDEELKN